MLGARRRFLVVAKDASKRGATLIFMTEDLKIVTTVGNEAEAEMVSERLSEAGISFTVRLASGGIRLGAAAARDVCVDGQDLDRAREALEVDEGFSDEELARLSDEAGKAARDETA
jgi:Putative prokaryotic signal transducing protein